MRTHKQTLLRTIPPSLRYRCVRGNNNNNQAMKARVCASVLLATWQYLSRSRQVHVKPIFVGDNTLQPN